MGNFIYKNIKTNEEVEDFIAKDYALEKLGLQENDKLVIIPRGKNGEYTKEQLENIEQTVEWFFSGNWIKEEVEYFDDDEDNSDLEKLAVLSDMLYDQEKDRRMGLI